MMEECVPATMLSDCQELLQSVRHILRYLQEEAEAGRRENTMGRPALLIEEEQLSFFVDNGFKVEDMALMLGCSKRTVERRLSTYNLSTRNYTAITDHELDEQVQELCSVFPRCGEKLVHGRLRAQGVYVQRQRVRQSLHRVDPSGVQARIRRVLHRS